MSEFHSISSDLKSRNSAFFMCTWATWATHSLALRPLPTPSAETLDRQKIFPASLSTVKKRADVPGESVLTCFRAPSNAYSRKISLYWMCWKYSGNFLAVWIPDLGVGIRIECFDQERLLPLGSVSEKCLCFLEYLGNHLSLGCPFQVIHWLLQLLERITEVILLPVWDLWGWNVICLQIHDSLHNFLTPNWGTESKGLEFRHLSIQQSCLL